MAIEWQKRLLETTKQKASASASPLPLQRVVQEIVAQGVPVAEVKSFLAERADVFGADAADVAKKAAEALLDQTSPKIPAPTSQVAGKKAHNVRLAPESALPWWSGLSVPQSTLKGTGETVVVDGEKFTANDVADLLKLAA